MNNGADKLKRCPDCGSSKSTSAFWQNKATSDGIYVYCKDCGRRRNLEAAEGRRLARPDAPTRRARVVEVQEGMKQCLDCEQVLPLGDFVRNRSTRDGRTPYCRPCQYSRVAESRQRLHGGSRHYHLKRRYGIGADEVLTMLEEQGGRCPICFRALTVAKVHVDHDHATGAIRGAICFSCNGGLGLFKDNADVLRRAADYLESRLPRLKLEATGVVRILYPPMPLPRLAPPQLGPPRPPLDIRELRRLALQC